MKIEDIVQKYPFSSAEATRLLEGALTTATVIGLETTRAMLELTSMGENPMIGEVSAYNRMCENVNKHAWTLDNLADLADTVAPVVDQYTFQGLMQKLAPLAMLDTRRPCLVGGHKHWFLRWQTRKWVTEAILVGQTAGQCEVTMAIVEDQESGQVAEVYPREVRFLDSVPAGRSGGNAE